MSRIAFLRLLLHNDEFGWLGGGKRNKKQLLMLLTAGEFASSVRGSNLVSNFPMLISNGKFWASSRAMLIDIFSEDIMKLAQGVLYEVGGRSVIVFAFIHGFLGDIPARKGIVGLSPSVNNAKPCPVCLLNKDELLDITKLTSTKLRRASDFPNNRLAGDLPSKYARYGVVFQSPVCFWPGQVNPIAILNDLMHSKYLGDVEKHFEHLFNSMRSTLPSSQRNTFFTVLREGYREYCKLNGISSFYKFTDFKSWRGLKAYGIKKFIEVFPYIALKAGLINDNNEFELTMLCIQRTICMILQQHAIVDTDLDTLESCVKELIRHWCIPNEYCSLNAHLDLHWRDTIQRFGAPREYWCFGGETIIRVLKAYYVNTNNRQVSKSIFFRFATDMAISLVNEISGHPNRVFLHRSSSVFNCNDVLTPFADDEILCSEDDIDLDGIMYLPRKDSLVLNYQQVKIGSYVLLLSTAPSSTTSSFLAKIIGFAWSKTDNVYYLLYQKPSQTDNRRMFSNTLQCFTFTKLLETTKYIARAHLFERTIAFYPWIQDDKYVVVV
jgi:hypothetical protein